MSETNTEELRLEKIKDGLLRGNISLDGSDFDEYVAAPDVMEKDNFTGILGYKYCSKCNTYKKLYMFYSSSNHKDGFAPECKKCRGERRAKLHENMSEEKKAKRKQYRKNSDKKRLEKQRLAMINGEYVPKEKTAGEITRDMRRRARNAEYRKTDTWKEVYKRSVQKREALKKANKGIPYTKTLIKQRDEGLPCILCGKPIEDWSDAQVDHLIPILIGGLDCFSNVSYVHSSCNHKKTKTALEINLTQVEDLRKRTEAFIDNHKELFK